MYLFLVHHLDTNTLLDITRLIVPNDWSIIWNPHVPHVGFGSEAAALPNCHPCCPLCVYISHDFPPHSQTGFRDSIDLVILVFTNFTDFFFKYSDTLFHHRCSIWHMLLSSH